MAAQETLRTETFPSGIASVGLGKVQRQIPADEPPALRPNEELAVIGKPARRHDGRAKVTGAVPFTADISLPGMLHARILRSPLPHARVRLIDLSAAARHPGVRGILLVADPNDPQSASLRYIGAPVAVIAAVSTAAAEDALRLIHVDYQSLPFVVDMDRGRAQTVPAVYESAEVAPGGHPSGWPAPVSLPLNGNVRGPAISRRGDVSQGFHEADIVVEAEYRTTVQTHCCLEPHGIVADWRADGLTVYISTQYTTGVCHELAEEFGLPLNRVRVIVHAMGGGFGSKSTLGNYGRFAVELSRRTQAPVRLVLDREEEQMDAGNRPGTWQRLRIGAKRDGALTAISLQSYGTAGVALGAGVGFNAEALYDCSNFEGAQHDVFINAGPGCAMRAPGNTPGAFGLEQAIDELAERLAIDPLVLRDRIDPSPVRREERRLGAERVGWRRRHAPGADPGPVKRGLGVAQSLWMANVQINSACEVRVMRDGTVEVLSSVQDIGTGTGTVLAQTVAEVFGLRPEAITVRIGDTEFPPGPPSYGSRATASITPPARTAAWRVLQSLLREAGLALNAAAEDLIARNGRIFVRDDSSRGISFWEAAARLRTDRISAVASRSDDYPGFRRRMGDAALAHQDLGGVQFAEVAVDTETGIVRVERVVAVQDCGRPINPRQIESQVHGGILMGLSYALFEERILDRHTGRMVNPDLEHYKLAGPRETPAIDVVILENYQGNSATDAYGIAEPANIATAPAIANAVYNAIGVRLRSLPMTPAAILAALGKIPEGGAETVNRFAFANARTISEAAVAASTTVANAMTISPEAAGHGEISVVKAGGIDLLDLLKEGLLAPAKVVNLKEVPGLDVIIEDDNGDLRIGPMVTLASLADHRLLRERYSVLAEVLRGSASPQIRNVATLGGNLLQRPRCWYFRSRAYRCLRKGGGHCFAISGENQYHAIFDNALCAIVHPSTVATALVALDAQAELTDAAGARRVVSLEDFFVPPDSDLQRENDLRPREILTSVRLSKPPASLRMAHVRQGERDSFDWPLADVAVALDVDAAGICRRAAVILGAAAPVPHRAKTAEVVLTGKRIDENMAAAAGRAALNGATPLSRNAFKLPLFETLVRRAILTAVA